MKRKPKKKTSKYKSGLEEQVAKLLEGLGVSYEYESCKIPYTIQHTLKQKDTGMHLTGGR